MARNMMTHPRRSIRVSAIVGGLVLGVAGAAATASSSQAHTDLVESSPMAGAVVTSAPTTVTLTFSEEISPALGAVTLVVGDDDRGRLRLRKGDEAGQVTAIVPSSPEAGASTSAPWVVNYRVTSLDGHPIAGSLEFQVEAAPAPSASPPATGSAPDQAPSDSTTEEATETEETDEEAQLASNGGSGTWIVPAGVVAFLGLLIIIGVRRLGRVE